MSARERLDRLEHEYSDIQTHLPYLRDVVIERNAQHVIELGTRTGVSTVAFLAGLESTGGRLTSIDIEPGPDLGEQPQWTFIQSDDLDPRLIGRLDPADIVFIDTSHHYNHTAAELRIYSQLIRRPGLILCHDVELRNPLGAPPFPPFPVRRAVIDVAAAEGWSWHIRPGSFGLAVIEVL